MEELFGVSMTTLMWVLLAITGTALGVVAVLAWRNPVMVKLGLRNIPRRPGQTALIIVGIMLSSIIMATAFGIGDTINHSIRTEAVESLGPIDEIVLSNRATSEDGFGFNPYFPMARFHELQAELAASTPSTASRRASARTCPPSTPGRRSARATCEWWA